MIVPWGNTWAAFVLTAAVTARLQDLVSEHDPLPGGDAWFSWRDSWQKRGQPLAFVTASQNCPPGVDNFM